MKDTIFVNYSKSPDGSVSKTMTDFPLPKDPGIERIVVEVEINLPANFAPLCDIKVSADAPDPKASSPSV
jgi:hypothetical protein